MGRLKRANEQSLSENYKNWYPSTCTRALNMRPYIDQNYGRLETAERLVPTTFPLSHIPEISFMK
jgi:hypothetical protein